MASLASEITINNYAYVLQAEQLAESRQSVVQLLTESGRDMLIIDAFYESSEDGRWKKTELQQMKSINKNRKIICYFSIGEAEVYRPYWNTDWNENKPEFILSENPDWPGNFKVKYWDQEWQKVIFTELEKISAQGFDGVMLDIVDGFQYFEGLSGQYKDNLVNPETGNTYREDMILFIKKIAEIGRGDNSSFMVIPQNGVELLESTEYCKVISAQALESLFVLPEKKQSSEYIKYMMKFLRKLMREDKQIFVTEYPITKALKDYAKEQASKYDMVYLLTVRELNILGDSGD